MSSSDTVETTTSPGNPVPESVAGPSDEGADTGEDRDEDNGLMILKSLCVNCGKSGETRLLLVKIPHFRDILVSSFRCSHCAYNNNDVQSTGQIQEQGQKITLKVENAKDLDRQLIKSDSCLIQVPELGLEIPRETQKGTLNTIERSEEHTSELQTQFHL